VSLEEKGGESFEKKEEGMEEIEYIGRRGLWGVNFSS